MSAEAKEEETPAQVTRDRARRKAFWKRKKVLQETKSVASPQVSVVIHPVNSGACLEPTHFVSETKTIASPQVSVVSHPVNSGACLEPTFFDSEPNIHLTLEKETVHTAKFQSDLNKLCAEETESEQSDSEIDSPSASGNCLKEGEQSLRCTGCTRFIQKVSGLLPLIKCLVSNTGRNYILRKMNTRPVV